MSIPPQIETDCLLSFRPFGHKAVRLFPSCYPKVNNKSVISLAGDIHPVGLVICPVGKHVLSK